MFVEHALIRPSTIEQRDYQTNIAEAAKRESTLLVLPTGLGKTVVALLVIADVLKGGGGKVLFLAPTKPLVQQHTGFLKEHLIGFEPAMLTGEVAPDERQELWRKARLIVSTPQVIENDLEERRISLEAVDLIVFDEAHRAVGDYSYVAIGIERRPGARNDRISWVRREQDSGGVREPWHHERGDKVRAG